MLDNICINCFEKLDEQGNCSSCGFPNVAENDMNHLKRGSILNGKFLIGKTLGQGGFGVTYLGYDLNLKLKVAIKEYLPHAIANRSQGKTQISLFSNANVEDYKVGLEKFLDEARMLAKFNNTANIVTVRDFFEENSTAYMVMDYMIGCELKDYIKKIGRKLSFDEAIEIFNPIMDALSVVHKDDVLHRDISPDNIFITYKLEPILLDFGAARQYANQANGLSIILKPGYAPEEQYRRNGNSGPWTDVYALAATFYHVITGKKPPESLDRLESDELVSPSSLGVQISPYAEQALLKALSVKADNRFQNVDDFKNSINGISTGNFEPYNNNAVNNNIASKQDFEQVSNQSNPVNAYPNTDTQNGFTQNGFTQTSSQQLNMDYNTNDNNKNGKKKRWWIIPAAIIGVIVVFFVVIIAGSEISDSKNYKEAMLHLDNGEYQTAMTMFDDLSVYDYKDSEELYNKSKYEYAMSLYQSGDYTGAKELFFELETYADSVDKVSEIMYAEAVNLIEQGKYKNGIDALKKIGRLSSIDSNTVDMIYDAGVSAYRADRHDEAYTCFSAIESKRKLDIDKYYLLITAKSISNNTYEEHNRSIEEAIGISYLNGFNAVCREIYSELVMDLEFEDTLQLLLNTEWISYYLEGEWTNGKYIYNQSSENYTEDNYDEFYPYSETYFTLPAFPTKIYYLIEDATYYSFSGEFSKETAVAEFDYNIIDENTMEVYCYKNGYTYTMRRK